MKEVAGITMSIGVILLISILWYDTGKQDIADDCMEMGSFRYDHAVYDCKPRNPSDKGE